MSQNHATIAVNSAVTYSLTLTNSTAGSITIEEFQPDVATQPNIPITLQVADSGGSVVYTNNPPLGAPAQPGHLVPVSLASGQSLSLSLTVSAFGKQDRYAATTFFTPYMAAGTPTQTAVGPLVLTAR